MLASDFDFDLPPELIAQHPAEPRDQSRLMVIDRRRGTWEHRVFADLPELLDPRDVLVRNDTRVVPARLVGHREATGGRWEGLFLRERRGGTWEVLAKTRGRPETGEHGGRRAGASPDAGGPRRVGLLDRPAARPGFDGEHRATTLALLERHGQTPCPRISAAVARGRATGSRIRPSTPAGRARPPRRRPGCTSPPRSSTGWPSGGSPAST